MSHMVIYRSVDGKPGFQQTDDLLSAVEFVERLRNTEGVENARIYRLEQVNFRFQPYYQVHLDQTEAPGAPRPLVGTVTPSAAPAQQPVQPMPVGSMPAGSMPAGVSGGVVSGAPMSSATPAPVPPAAPEQPAQAAPHGDPSYPGSEGVPGDPNDLGNGIRRGLFGR